MKTYKVTINDRKPEIYENILEVAGLFHKSHPAYTATEWHGKLLQAFQEGRALVNTGIDGNRTRAEVA